MIMRTLIVLLVCVTAMPAMAGTMCWPMGSGSLSCKGPHGHTTGRIDYIDGEYAGATIEVTDEDGDRRSVKVQCMRIDGWLDCDE